MITNVHQYAITKRLIKSFKEVVTEQERIFPNIPRRPFVQAEIDGLYSVIEDLESQCKAWEIYWDRNTAHE